MHASPTSARQTESTAYQGRQEEVCILDTSNLAHLKEAEGFHVDISDERKLISDTINASESWKNTATPILQRILNDDVNKLALKAAEVTKSDPSKVSKAFSTPKEVDLAPLDLEGELEDDKLLGGMRL